MSLPVGTEAMSKINRFEYQAIPSARKLFERYGLRKSNGIYTCDERGGKCPPLAVGSMIEQISSMEQALKEQMELDAATAAPIDSHLLEE